LHRNAGLFSFCIAAKPAFPDILDPPKAGNETDKLAVNRCF
jgi:hypothetical protein